MTEKIMSNLVTIGGSLLGVLVGGVISFLTSAKLERQRSKRERRDKLDVARREALGAVLEWIEPMRNAEIRASSLVTAAIQGDIDDDEFNKEFPYLLGELKKKDLPGSQRALLPQDTYARGIGVVQELEQLRILGIRYGQRARVRGESSAGFQECHMKLSKIRKQISEIEEDIRKAFLGTFE